MPKKDRSGFSEFKGMLELVSLHCTLRNYECVSELNRKRKIAKQSDDFAKLAEVYNELGDEYRRVGE